jgi:hypothetical protein
VKKRLTTFETPGSAHSVISVARAARDFIEVAPGRHPVARHRGVEETEAAIDPGDRPGDSAMYGGYFD